MSSREPMWYCHECHAEMRPLMVPDPHCASCNGTFVEQLDNPEDDPREYQYPHDGIDDDSMPPDMDGFLVGLRALLQSIGSPPGASTSPLGVQRSQSEGPAARAERLAPGNGTGLTIRIQGSPGGTRTMFIGGGGASGNREGRDNVPPMFSEFVSRGPDARPDRTIAGPLMAQYLLAMMGGRPGARSMNDFFGGSFGLPEGAENGQWGDYVFNQEALDQIITQIMENTNATAPVPATEEIMENLPREVLEEGSFLLEKDCAICKEQFKLETEDPDELIVVTLPCKHPFHEPCIIPWLKSSGTCPVCRYQLVPQPEHHPPGPQSPGGSSLDPNQPSSPSSPRQSPGSSPSGRTGHSLFGSLFGGLGGGSSSSSSSGGHASSSSGNPSQIREEEDIPGAWAAGLD